MQEEPGETVCIERNGVGKWLCPLCQQGLCDRSSLSAHLTEQHSVLPSCVDRLLDIVSLAVLKQAASEAEADKSTLQFAEGEVSPQKSTEETSSDRCQSKECSDTTQTFGDMEEDRIMERDGGEADSVLEDEESPNAEAKQQNATENPETPDEGLKCVGKKGVPSFRCNACLESFPNRTALSVHYNSATHILRMTTNPAKPGGESSPLSRPFISSKPYQCAVCRVSYNHAITLESHMKSVLHQTRSRSAGMVSNTTNSAASASSRGRTTSSPNTIMTTSESVCSPLGASSVTTAPGTVMASGPKDGEQLATSQVAPSLLTSPVASAQAVSAFLTLLTSSPSTISHSILPSLFAAGAAPGATAPQLVPQPQMVMPLILNGLQAQTQQHQENQQGQILTRCVPLIGLNPAQQTLLTQRLNGSQNQWPSSAVPGQAQPSQKELMHEEKQERKNTEGCQAKDAENDMSDGLNKEEKKEEYNGIVSNHENKERTDTEWENMKETESTMNEDGSTNPSNLKEDKDLKSPLHTNLSPSSPVLSHSNLSPVNLNLTLSPDPTPPKSQSGASPGGSSKSSPRTNALTINQNPLHRIAIGPNNPDLPVLSEFQSEVLWAFFESRSEADAASPPHEDCEALGREVGLSEEEVRKWLTQACYAKQRLRATELKRAETFTKNSQGSDYDYDDEENSLVIAEGDDDAEASSSQIMDLSSTKGKRKRKNTGKKGLGDSGLTSDSESELYTSVVVADEESQTDMLKEGTESPARHETPSESHSDKGSSGGKVLRSTTVFLSDAEDEYEDDENGGGQKSKKKKRKGDFEREEVDGKKERTDSDVDLELEAQGDPPGTAAMEHTDLPAGALQSLPLSIASFSPQLLSPYVLSLTPSMVRDGGKISVFSNPQTVTQFSGSLLSQSLSSHNQASHYLANGDDCESALDLSMGKNNKSASSSLSLADKIAAQKGQLLDGLGLRPTSKGLVVVQVKPESGTTHPPTNSPLSLANSSNMVKSNIFVRASDKINTTYLERDQDKEKGKEVDQQKKSKGKRYQDMRRSRTIIQAEQLDILYGCYFKDPNPGKLEFEQISEWVHLPKKVVQIWFQNMRARERKGEVRFISDGTLAAVGKPLIRFTWPLTKPIFSNKPAPINDGGVAATPTVQPLLKPDGEMDNELAKQAVVKKIIPVPIKPKEMSSSITTISPVSSSVSAVPKTKLETTSNPTLVKISPKVNASVLLAPPKEPVPIAPKPTQKQQESEEEKTDEEKDDESELVPGPGTVNRMVPKLASTPINNRLSAATVVPQKQNGINYWTPKVPIKINTLSREQLALPTHNRTIPPPPTPSIAPVSPNTPNSGKGPSPRVVTKSSPSESVFQSHASSRRPRTHLSCLQLSILQSCYETCAHPNAMECEAIGTELNLPLKVVQIWFQNTRAKEKRWKLQQEKLYPMAGGKVDTSSGSYLQYSALKANRPILPKPVQLTITSENATSPVPGQTAPKETLTGHCDACNVSFESRAAARAHVFSPNHLAKLRMTNFGQPIPLVSKSSSQTVLSTTVTTSGTSSDGEIVIELPPSKTTSNS